jgi:hypothetical protein
LDPVQRIRGLQVLSLFNISDSRVQALRLPTSLKSLFIGVDDPEMPGESVREIVKAIDWERLAGLTELRIMVGGLHVMRPIEVDLGFLGHLPNLERLDIHGGVVHDGSEPSPLTPPFLRLSQQLTWIGIDADEPEVARPALRAYLNVAADDEERVGVGQRYPYVPSPPPWSIQAPSDETDLWRVYGSLYKTEHGAFDGTEYDALKRAKSRLRAADPKLLRCLDFDPESAGTAIFATSREELQATLEILNLPPSSDDPSA